MLQAALTNTGKLGVPACEVDLATRTIRFKGSEGCEAVTSAAEERITVLSGQIVAPKSHLTNRQRKELNRDYVF